MILRPDHIGLIVSDLARSKRFYESLGFREDGLMEARDGSRTIVFMVLGDFRLELFWSAPQHDADQRGQVAEPCDEKDSRFRHLALRTDDVELARGELAALGLVSEDAEIREVWGGLRLLYLRDPDGTEIEIMERAERPS